jgi:glycosyltransferase involved in cell wall biosynthesis
VTRKVKKDALIVIGRLSYPSPTAPSNRVHLYCKALKKEKGFPFVINLHSAFIDPQPFNYLARFEGIPFFYSQKTVMREKRLFIRNMNKIKGLINTLIILKKIKRKHDFKVLFYTTEVWEEFILFIFLKLMHVSIIKECSEIPNFIIREKKAKKIHRFFLKINLRMYDQLIVISDFLKSFYSEIFPKVIYQIPILVDMKRFGNADEKKYRKNSIITYVGSMGGNKDGLEDLIDAMAIVKEKDNKFQLLLIGSAPDKDLIGLKNKVDALGLTEMILFLGKKKIEEIPFFLENSDILVLARPDNNQAKAGFPTKLGEYLASAKPVVITRTGEIPKYLKHNFSAYLTNPDDVEDFANKVIYALSDKNSEAIGKRGYEVANNCFNYELYGKKILNIVKN